VLQDIAVEPYLTVRETIVLAAWGAAGALVAIRRFRWDPRGN
jgi:hypothetical protein